MWCVKEFGSGFFKNAKLLLSFPILLIPLARGDVLQAAIVFPAISMADFFAQKCVANLSMALSSVS